MTGHSNALAASAIGRSRRDARVGGALLGIGAAAPATLLLLFVAFGKAAEGGAGTGAWAALALAALAAAALGAWISAVGMRFTEDEAPERLTSLLRRLSAGETGLRFGAPYPAGASGQLARAADGVADRLAEMREMMERHRVFGELSQDFFLRLAPDGAFLSVSPSIARVLGYASEEMIGRSSYDFLHPDDLASARRTHDAVLSGDTTPGVVRMRRKTGGYVSVEISARLRLCTEHGLAREILGVGRDVTERAEHSRELERARRDGASNGRARLSFLAHMSHDLRTPLNIIIGLSQIIRDQMFGAVGSQRYVDYARDIESSGHDLLDLINDLFDLSTVESGRWQLDERAVSVPRNIEAVFTMISDRARIAEVALTSEVAADLPLLFGDERAVRQILMNVVSSAVKRITPSSTLSIDGCITDGEMRLTVCGSVRPVGSRDGYAKDPLAGSVSLTLAADLMRLHGGRLETRMSDDNRFAVTLAFPAQRCLTSPVPAPPEPGA
jgi:PAS domain S-box-containing protein